MKKREFIKLSGLAGIATLVPKPRSIANEKLPPPPDACVLIPSETAGPYPLDLSENTQFLRTDIRESQAGAELNLRLKIIGQDNCLPMRNVRVNIWHCDRVGNYSGYGSEQGKTYLRGYQFTDANGIAEFTTIFPGWYNGRICHIHFQVHVSTSYSAVSQLSFDIANKNALYDAYPSLYTKGRDPLNFSQDNIFSDGYQYQLATLINEGNDKYSSSLEVTVKGAGTLGRGHQEAEAAKHMKLGQNYPNPYNSKTIIPITLIRTSDVTLTLYDLQGNKTAVIYHGNMNAGEHTLEFDPAVYGLPPANYVYELKAHNADGIFTDVKMMTALK